MKHMILLLLIASGCGGVPMPKESLGTGVDPVFEPFIESFQTAYGRPVGSFPITFQSVPDFSKDVIGECIRYPDGEKEIVIDKDYWDDSDTIDGDREMLLFHELGHCELGLEHNNNDFPSGAPVSLMNAYIFNVQTYEVNKTYYINQLFGR